MRFDTFESLVSQPWFRWGVALAIVAAGTLALTAARSFVHRRLARAAPLTESRLDDLLAAVPGSTRLVFLVALSTLLALSAL